MVQTTLAYFPRLFVPLHDFLSQHPSLVVSLRIACVLSLFFLLVSLLVFAVRDACIWMRYQFRASDVTGQDVNDRKVEGSTDRKTLPKHVSSKGGGAFHEFRISLVARAMKPGSLFSVPEDAVLVVPDGVELSSFRALDSGDAGI